MTPLTLTPPLKDEDIAPLKAGTPVRLSGIIHTARDAAHMRMKTLLDTGRPLPFDPVGAVIDYVGPSPAPPGQPVGAAGPTTSGRMDPYTPALHAAGVKATIGKGKRSRAVQEALRTHNCIYLGATGGAGALLAACIKSAEIVAFPELGPEAVRRLEVEDFPCMVLNDAKGGCLYSHPPPAVL